MLSIRSKIFLTSRDRPYTRLILFSFQWVEILLATTAPLVSSYRQFRIINLPELMMKTMADYVNHDDYLNLWLSRVSFVLWCQL